MVECLFPLRRRALGAEKANREIDKVLVPASAYRRIGRLGPLMARTVWTGRALQVGFDDLEAIGLALLYPALEWNVCVPGHHGYSLGIPSHGARPSPFRFR